MLCILVTYYCITELVHIFPVLDSLLTGLYDNQTEWAKLRIKELDAMTDTIAAQIEKTALTKQLEMFSQKLHPTTAALPATSAPTVAQQVQVQPRPSFMRGGLPRLHPQSTANSNAGSYKTTARGSNSGSFDV
jgi:hypothetical protein